MTTEIEIASVPIVKPRFNWLLALAILALGLLVAVFAATLLPTTATKIAAQPVAERAVGLTPSQGPTLAEYAAREKIQASQQQAIEAARYSGLAGFYTTGNGATLPASLVDNPELMIAHRYIVVENRIDPDRDIGLVEFFSVPNEVSGQRAIEAEAARYNGLATFYSSVGEKRTTAVFLAANPELMVASRYVAPGVERAGSYFLASNPELMVAQHYATIARQKIDAILLGENPELMIARRFAAAQIEWNRLHPGR